MTEQAPAPTPLAHPANPPALLTADQAAAICGVSRSYFLVMGNSGRLGPRVIKLGRCSRWSADELRQWAKAGAPPRPEWVKIREQSQND